MTTDIKVGDMIQDANGNDWLIARAFDWEDYVDFTLVDADSGANTTLRLTKGLSE